jgi:hypothetical protein
MRTIPLKPEFTVSVRSGRKTSTIRRGHRAYDYGPAMIVAQGEQIPIEIVSVRHARLKDLSEEDATADGFRTVDELRLVLDSFYPGMRDDEEVTVVRFKLA